MKTFIINFAYWVCRCIVIIIKAPINIIKWWSIIVYWVFFQGCEFILWKPETYTSWEKVKDTVEENNPESVIMMFFLSLVLPIPFIVFIQRQIYYGWKELEQAYINLQK